MAHTAEDRYDAIQECIANLQALQKSIEATHRVRTKTNESPGSTELTSAFDELSHINGYLQRASDVTAVHVVRELKKSQEVRV